MRSSRQGAVWWCIASAESAAPPRSSSRSSCGARSGHYFVGIIWSAQISHGYSSTQSVSFESSRFLYAAQPERAENGATTHRSNLTEL